MKRSAVIYHTFLPLWGALKIGQARVTSPFRTPVFEKNTPF
jgi:hypothetical protein